MWTGTFLRANESRISASVERFSTTSMLSSNKCTAQPFSYITSAGAGSAYNLTATEQRGDNTLRFTTDPTGTIPGGTVVQIVATPSSGSPFTGFYEVATIDSTQSASNIWDVTFVPILNAPSWSGHGIAGTYTINQQIVIPIKVLLQKITKKTKKNLKDMLTYCQIFYICMIT